MVACQYSSLDAAQAVLGCILLLFGHFFPKDRNAQMNSISVVIMDTDCRQTLTKTTINPAKIPEILGGWPEYLAINEEFGMYVNEQPEVCTGQYNAAATNLIAFTHALTLQGELFRVYGKAILFGLKNAKGERDGYEHSLPKWWCSSVILRNPKYLAIMMA